GQNQRRLQGPHRLAPPAVIRVDQVLPVAGRLEQPHALVRQQAPQPPRLRGPGGMRIVAREAGEDAGEAERPHAPADLRRHHLHVRGQKTAAHSETHGSAPAGWRSTESNTKDTKNTKSPKKKGQGLSALTASTAHPGGGRRLNGLFALSGAASSSVGSPG